jgi:hypothetical protein
MAAALDLRIAALEEKLLASQQELAVLKEARARLPPECDDHADARQDREEVDKKLDAFCKHCDCCAFCPPKFQECWRVHLPRKDTEELRGIKNILSDVVGTAKRGRRQRLDAYIATFPSVGISPETRGVSLPSGGYLVPTEKDLCMVMDSIKNPESLQPNGKLRLGEIAPPMTKHDPAQLLTDLNAVIPFTVFPKSRRRATPAAPSDFGSERLIFCLRRYCQSMCEALVPGAGNEAYRMLVRGEAGSFVSKGLKPYNLMLEKMSALYLKTPNLKLRRTLLAQLCSFTARPKLNDVLAAVHAAETTKKSTILAPGKIGNTRYATHLRLSHVLDDLGELPDLYHVQTRLTLKHCRSFSYFDYDHPSPLPLLLCKALSPLPSYYVKPLPSPPLLFLPPTYTSPPAQPPPPSLCVHPSPVGCSILYLTIVRLAGHRVKSALSTRTTKYGSMRK